MLTFLVTASAAAAFDATHVVVTDDAVVYDEGHHYDDAYIIARPPFWTPVRCEPVGSPESPRTYCRVTLADGTAGLAEWDYFGKLYVAARDATLRAAPGDDRAAAGRIAVGEAVAEVALPVLHQPGGFHEEDFGDKIGVFYDDPAEYWREVVTADGRRGWLPASALNAEPSG